MSDLRGEGAKFTLQIITYIKYVINMNNNTKKATVHEGGNPPVAQCRTTNLGA